MPIGTCGHEAVRLIKGICPACYSHDYYIRCQEKMCRAKRDARLKNTHAKQRRRQSQLLASAEGRRPLVAHQIQKMTPEEIVRNWHRIEWTGSHAQINSKKFLDRRHC